MDIVEFSSSKFVLIINKKFELTRKKILFCKKLLFESIFAIPEFKIEIKLFLTNLYFLEFQFLNLYNLVWFYQIFLRFQ